ncbi:helix-turn-helix domain-containing protein [Kribbella deserti]|uniref:Helix-turn-helix domain-containing protein n=1 Tax=Kribbella deserti TaxID=1926257 RepID=A0ABV6QHD9_9ACTN
MLSEVLPDDGRISNLETAQKWYVDTLGWTVTIDRDNGRLLATIGTRLGGLVVPAEFAIVARRTAGVREALGPMLKAADRTTWTLLAVGRFPQLPQQLVQAGLSVLSAGSRIELPAHEGHAEAAVSWIDAPTGDPLPVAGELFAAIQRVVDVLLKRRQAIMIDTVDAYLASGSDPLRTATILGIDRGELVRRLAMIRELTGLDLADASSS